MPRVSSLNHPAACLPTRMQGQARIASTTRCDVCLVAFQHHDPVRWGVVIGRIQTQMLWPARARTWSDNRTVTNQFGEYRRIVNIGGCHQDAQRNSSAIDQHMVFNSGFGAISRIRPGLFSPPRATARRCRRHFAMPTRLHVAHRRGANTWHGFAHIPRHASTLRSGHTRSATGRTLSARHATDNPPITHRGWHPGSGGHRCVGGRHIRVADWVGAAFRSPPTSHQEFVVGFASRQLTNLLGLQTRFK